MERMRDPEFWRGEARFEVLGDAEYLDRIDHGVRGAGSLLDRLLGSQPGQRLKYPRDLVGRLAERLYLLDAACAGVAAHVPRDAFLRVETDEGRDAEETQAFAARLGDMYQAWGRKRGMEVQVLAAPAAAGSVHRLVLAVGGYAAYRILEPESGLHVLELPPRDGEGAGRRLRVQVHVAPQPAAPPGPERAATLRQADDALRAAPGRQVVVRRYRDAPPLVRDGVRHWRSGKLDRVLGGDFDLIVGGDAE
jgi:ATP-dependent Clp protease ATP-binding subunit ClpC